MKVQYLGASNINNKILRLKFKTATGIETVDADYPTGTRAQIAGKVQAVIDAEIAKMVKEDPA